MPGQRPPRLGLAVEQRDDRWLIALDGELDVDSVRELSTALAAAPPTAPVVLDLRGLMFIDTTGLREILEFDKRSRQPPARPFALVPCRPTLHRVFEVSGLAGLLRFVESPDEAL